MDERVEKFLTDSIVQTNYIPPEAYSRYNVKRGLRNEDGTGVIAGLTNISNVHGYVMSDGIKTADDGLLRFRGYDVYDLLGDQSPDHRYNYEEVAYLLLMGKLPTQSELDTFIAALDAERALPDGFIQTIMLPQHLPDIMNVLSRSIMMLYSRDPNAEDRSYSHEMHTAISIISRLPRIMVLAYYAMQAHYYGGSLIMHPFIPGQTTAETILSMLRPDRSFTKEEARMLDIMLCLHAEHGGGNNSTFTVRVMSSADTDPYSVYSAALGSLKGNRHGGANRRVVAMHKEIKANVKNWEDEDEVAAYLTKIVRRDAFDKSGLIYGMGHAVYTRSDPRAVICKRFAGKLAEGTVFEQEYHLLETIERVTPGVVYDVKGTNKDFCANIDMYSGFVYRMLGIPEDLYTPLFACGRIAGWAAHRFEEIVSGRRIIRPAYKTTFHGTNPYIPISERV